MENAEHKNHNSLAVTEYFPFICAKPNSLKIKGI